MHRGTNTALGGGENHLDVGGSRQLFDVLTNFLRSNGRNDGAGCFVVLMRLRDDCPLADPGMAFMHPTTLKYLALSSSSAEEFGRSTTPMMFIAVAVTVFVIQQLINWVISIRRWRKARQRFLLALASEVELNVIGLQSSLSAFPSDEEFQDFLVNGPKDWDDTRRRNNPLQGDFVPRPFVMSVYPDEVFQNGVAQLNDVPEGLVRSIIEFYATLRYIETRAEAIEKKSFATTSLRGKLGAVRSLRRRLGDAALQGEGVVRQIKLLL